MQPTAVLAFIEIAPCGTAEPLLYVRNSDVDAFGLRRWDDH
jgi:hypothetical protein